MTAWVDGQQVGGNESGQTAFSIDVTAALGDGAEHVVVVRAFDDPAGTVRARLRLAGPAVAGLVGRVALECDDGPLATASHPLVNRGQNVAIGLTGLPDVPAKRTGATARWKSHWPSSAAVVAHASRSQLSSSHRPIATRLTA